MSSLSITGSSLSYSAFQALTGGQQSAGTSGSATTDSTDPLLAPASTSGTSSTTSATSSPADALLSATSGGAPQAHGGHHHRHGGGGFKKIEDAVTNALQSAQADPTADPNSLIENAIAGVLGNAQSAAGQASAGVSAVDGSSATSALTVTDPNAGGSVLGSSSSAANGGAGGLDFNQLLQSLGVTPQQFHTDFLNAVKDAQNGQVNTNTALQSIPSGSVVNVLA